ncbi:iron-containing alcohol dehydrogenase [Pseudomonas oryzihabitans]|uniref:iron-containing alcohol dehydrogenase n=1 Tax=Pseudomonas oryzihabitans TaxID=47885 RepID=UPI002895ED2C|nr:iron-containing alcohol dehydrogenase [Pseudomonas oryzihabitans]MDT3719866.1 iron-containing alcohol dehydrogenase [Pseudomonas oryzihabitans]
MTSVQQRARQAAWLDLELFFGQRDAAGFYSPTRLLWGADCADGHLRRLTEGFTGQVLVMLDAALVEHRLVRALLTRLGTRAQVLTAAPLPDAVALRETAATLDWSALAAIVAIGGGSALDSAKALLGDYLFAEGYAGIGLGSRRGEAARPERVKPLFIAVPSTAGSGADSSRYLVTYDKRGAHWTKVHGKSWQLTADVTLLDGQLLVGAPPRVVVEPAFDAFVHACESFSCRGEANLLTRALCREALQVIGQTLRLLLAGGALDADQATELLVAASLAGTAISNARTGHVHEAGGAALEWLEGVSHAQTLWLFLREGLQQTAASETGRAQQAELARTMGFATFAEVLDGWQELLGRAGSRAQLAAALARLAASGNLTAAQAAVVDRVLADRVWCDKECPVPLGAEQAWRLAACLEQQP